MNRALVAGVVTPRQLEQFLPMLLEGVADPVQRVKVFEGCLKVLRDPNVGGLLNNSSKRKDVKSLRRYRAGHYRIGYSYEAGVVTFVKIGFRKDFYDQLA